MFGSNRRNGTRRVHCSSPIRYAMLVAFSSIFIFAIPVSSSALSSLKLRSCYNNIPNSYTTLRSIPPGGSLNVGSNPIRQVFDSYSNALVKFPFTTKGITAFFLYALSDVIAQIQSLEKKIQSIQEKKEHLTQDTKNELKISLADKMSALNMPRLLKFSIKGVFGTSVWEVWFDYSEKLLDRRNVHRLLKIASMKNGSGGSSIAISRMAEKSTQVFLMILLEQFIASPLYFGLFELPISTILNGAPLSRIPHEIEEKLVSMLYANFQVWTPANVVVYSAPLKYRTVICNIFNIFWQIIVSNFAADCGE